MVAKGKDASDLFPAVVKNVAAKNLEVLPFVVIFYSSYYFGSNGLKLQLKKLVYVYLVRYAEEQQDLALLSISTFQRALKVPCMGGSLGRGEGAGAHITHVLPFPHPLPPWQGAAHSFALRGKKSDHFVHF